MRNLNFLILLITVGSCDQTNSKTQTNKSTNCFPTVIIEAEADTLKIGEIFRAKVYLSDTSYYELVNWGDGREGPTNAVFNVNGQITYSPGKNYLDYEEIVTNKAKFEELPELRQIRFGIYIPHPDPFGGDIEISKIYNYVAIE